MYRIYAQIMRPLVLLLAVGFLPALAAAQPFTSYTLSAEVLLNLPTPDPKVFISPCWGFRDVSSLANGDDHNAPAGATVQVPGPVLEFQEGSAMTIHLQNGGTLLTGTLKTPPVSLIIPGLLTTTATRGVSTTAYPPATPAVGAPVYDAAAPQAPSRVRSFAPEAAPGAPVTYTFTARAGTYLYESSTVQQIQVPMGLYGAVIVRPALFNATTNKIAYAGIPFDNENSPLVISDFDAGQNASFSLAPTGPFATNTFAAHFSAINGKFSPQTDDIVAYATKRSLVRLLNAGTEDYQMTFAGQTVSVIAEDGFPKNHPRNVTSVELPAGKTIDVIITPSATGYFPVYDRTLNLINGDIYLGPGHELDVAVPPQGLSTFLTVNPASFLGTTRTCSPLKGKAVATSQTVTVTDALHALRQAVGSEAQNLNLDVAVSGTAVADPSGYPCGDGVVDINDALAILQKAVGANPF
jgi:FtsP/CotA-like multicopper oxidase with cupredoxin domain